MRRTRSPASTRAGALLPGTAVAAPWLAVLATVAFSGCRFDPAYRDIPVGGPAPSCTLGAVECRGQALSRCTGDANQQSWTVIDDCSGHGQVCAPTLLACAPCLPGGVTCNGPDKVQTCDPTGQTQATSATCDNSKGEACRSGGCVNLCTAAADDHSNIGCEYWGADLDNAVVSPSLNAAAQQYAIVVSNAQPDLPANVTIDQDDSSPGSAAMTRTVATATIAPRNLEVFKLGPREVDGSPDGTFNTGTGTALTRHAYRVRSSVPIVAYQFNPLDNVNVFSNDASQLLPTSALSGAGGSAYVVAGWPQTIAISANPAQNFGINLRGFLAVIATAPNTHVHLTTTARVIPGGPFADGIPAGGQADTILQPFEVLNLETGDFEADFTGSTLTADGPVVVFPGSEASDAPFYSTLADRYCCADHLENQLPPVRTAGKSYVLSRMPNRSRAVIAAGGTISPFDEPEYYRVVATKDGATHVTTTLPSPDDAFDLTGVGDVRTLTVHQDLTLDASQPVIVADMQASQDASGVVRGLPGGDPSLSFPAPVPQWRDDYVLLTPDKYVFDYLVITAPSDAHVFLDGMMLGSDVCEVTAADGLDAAQRGSPTPPYLAYRCQLSYPTIDPTMAPPNNIQPGKQNDGVHHVQADLAVGVVAYGFDSYVSYAYTGGTQLIDISAQ